MNQEDTEHETEENESDNHPNEFFCGICGWSPISSYPHSH